VTDMLQHADVETVLRRFNVAIERDQLRVDAIPRERFDPSYDDSMWRDWRNGHRIYLNRLVSTVADMQPSLLEKLSGIARSYKHEFIRTVILEILSEVVSGSCDQEEYATASQLFRNLTEQVQRRAKASARGQCAKVSLARWFPLSDPLRIAADSECQYGPSVSLALLIEEIAPSADA
jgi:hypothetical protein